MGEVIMKKLKRRKTQSTSGVTSMSVSWTLRFLVPHISFGRLARKDRTARHAGLPFIRTECLIVHFEELAKLVLDGACNMPIRTWIKLPASVSGMAIASPKAVVNRAWPMSPASALGSFPCVCTSAIFAKAAISAKHRSQQAQHGGGPHDGRDPRRAIIEIGQHLALECLAQVPAELLSD